MSELSPEVVAALLGGSKTPQGATKDKPPKTKFIVKHTQYPAHNTTHVKRSDEALRCASRGCSAPTWLKLDGVAYCYVHIIFGLAVMVDRLESDLAIAKKGYGIL